MSIQSVDDFDPKSTTPVFGSAVSQTKLQQQQQPVNDLGGTEKLVTPPGALVNGRNETPNNKTSDNLGNGNAQSATESNATADATDTHVNGQNGKLAAETQSSTGQPVSTTAPESTEKTSQNDPVLASSTEPTTNVTSTTPAPTEPEPALSTTSDVAKDNLSSAPLTVADNAPPVPALSVEEPRTSNEDVPASATAPEATVLAESSTTSERKSKVNIFVFLIDLFPYSLQ